MSSDDLIRLLDELGQRLGPTGERVFALAVRQVYIEAITAAVLLAVTVAITAIAAPRIYRWVQANPTYGSRDMVGMIVAILWTLPCVFVAIFAVVSIPAVLNPEYAALRSLMSSLPR